MRIADAMMKYLELNEVECVFGIAAGTTSAIVDAIIDTKIQQVTVRHEGAASYCANAYSGMSNKLGVCMVGGIGAANALTGIYAAKRDKNPVLIITGAVQREQMGKGAIQELDTETMFNGCTRYSKMVQKEDVLSELKKAIELALTPPFAPVHICVPMDLQKLEFTGELPLKVDTKLLAMDLSKYKDSINKASYIINKEEKGIIMVGKGARGFSKKIKELSKHLQWPIITTPQAKGVISTDFELNLGNYGFQSTDSAYDYVKNGQATCLLVLGSSLGESATLNYNPMLVKNRKVVHVDWDCEELGKTFETDVKINADLKIALPDILKVVNNKEEKFERELPLNKLYEKNHTGLSIRVFLEQIIKVLPKDTQYICDIGEFMNFVFKYLPIDEESDFDMSLNYGAMGSGVGSAVGVSMAKQNSPVAVIVGDGSFLMNGMEIITAKEYNRPIIYFVVNNAMLSYVEYGHKFIYGRTLPGFKQERIELAQMTKAMGINSMKISSIEDIMKINEFITDFDRPYVIELVTDGSERPAVADRFKALAKI